MTVQWWPIYMLIPEGWRATGAIRKHSGGYEILLELIP